ncbi:MAG TPA: gamma subclass chorismate mutase AroQ, partial [Chthoniobacterales bacterium]
MPRLPLLLCLLALSACATPPPATFTAAESALVSDMGRRLALAREVAWIKYLDGRPIRDPAREAAVLDSVTHAAAARGLDAIRTREFFAAQIDASCAEQAALIRQWKRGAPLPTFAPRSLGGAVRQDIDAANGALLDSLGQLS